MTVKVIGKKYWLSKKENIEKECYMLNIAYEQDGVDGLACSSVFVPKESYAKYKVGDEIADVYIDYARHSLSKSL